MRSSLRKFAFVAPLALAAITHPGTHAATITFDYNGFNPGQDVTVRNGTNYATVLQTQTANVAGDTATSFSFDLTSTGSYAVDLYGNVGSSASQSGYRIQFNYDHALGQVTSIASGSAAKVDNFTAGTTITLKTVDVYIDPAGYDPANDSNNGFRLYSYRSTSLIALGDSLTYANEAKAVRLVNDLPYVIQYGTAQNQHRQTFTVGSGGGINASTGLVNEGQTVNNTGGTGTTHQLVRLNVKPITINTNGLSYSLIHADRTGSATGAGYALNTISPAFNGLVDVLAGDLATYRLWMPRHGGTNESLDFEVSESGSVTMTRPSDPRATASGTTLTLRTQAVIIDAPTDKENTVYKLNMRATPAASASTQSELVTNLKGDTTLTLLPNLEAAAATYFLSVPGALTTDARDSWKLIYDAATSSMSITTWSDAAGTTMVTGLQTYTTPGSGYTISVPEPGTLSLLAVTGLALGARRRRSRHIP